MKLKTSANAARERIAQMIVSGNILFEKVTAEYSAAKKAGTFDEKNDILVWKEQQVDWLPRWNYPQIKYKRTSRKSSEKVSRGLTPKNRVTPSLRTSGWVEIA